MTTIRLFSPSRHTLPVKWDQNFIRSSSILPIHGPMPDLVNDREPSGKGPRNIIVPLDGTSFAEHAIPVAIGIAEEFDAVVHLVHVFVAIDELDPYDVLHFPDASIATIKRRKHKYLTEIVHRLSETTSALVSGRLIDGRAVPQTLYSLEGVNADLVIMATHGRTPLGRLWWGNVAYSFLQKTTVPLILVRGSDEQPSFESRSVTNVLLPLSGEKASEKVLDSLIDLGVFAEARHTMLHVVPREPKHVVREGALRTDWIPSGRRWMAGMRYLQPLANSLRESGRHVHTKVVSSDEMIGQAVLQSADDANVDLIAMMYRQRGPLGRLLWPRVSEYLFRNAARPLMFIPSQ